MLDVLVDVLDLRAFDTRGILRQTNVRRYLRGERVGEDVEARAQLTFAEALVAAGLIPRVKPGDFLPDVPSDLGESATPHIISVALDRYARHWDELAGAVRRLTAPIAFPKHAAAACMRLVAIDLAVRIAAVLWLARNDDECPLSDFWLQPRGVGLWLRELMKRVELTRDGLANTAGVPESTADEWLDGDRRPDEGNLGRLSTALSEAGLGAKEVLLLRLRLAFAARDLFRAVEMAVGTRQARAICQRIAGDWSSDVCSSDLEPDKRERSASGSLSMRTRCSSFHGRVCIRARKTIAR